jgi:hypothetical protein
MTNKLRLLCGLALLALQFTAVRSQTVVGVIPQGSATIQYTYDDEKNTTTIRISPVQISGQRDKYRSLHMSPSFSFAGATLLSRPAIIDFELQTVVKGRLNSDLYVVFLIDGEKVFLSSNRWAIKRPVPGRVWVGERLVFRMPYETYVKVTRASDFQIRLGAIQFPVGDTQKQALRELLRYMQPHE